MAKYNSSPFGNISGEVLGVVASSNKGIKFLKNKGKITDAKTAKQLARRAIYGEFCTLWDDKSLDGSYIKPNQVHLKKDYFKLVLGACLKFSQSASLLHLMFCPDDGTMSAPIFTMTEVVPRGAVGSTAYGTFLFPAYSSDGEFSLCSASFGENYFEELQTGTRLSLYSIKSITSRELTEGNRIPNNSYMATIGQKMFRSFWYINKTTGQTSKPVCIACDDANNIEVFYPFGK